MDSTKKSMPPIQTPPLAELKQLPFHRTDIGNLQKKQSFSVAGESENLQSDGKWTIRIYDLGRT